jgi:hypothetical protein
MVWDFVLEFLAYLGIRALKKKKKEDTESTDAESIVRDQEQDPSGDEKREGISVCVGCNRTVEKGAIYELEKTWCIDCYKSNVLKIHE